MIFTLFLPYLKIGCQQPDDFTAVCMSMEGRTSLYVDGPSIESRTYVINMTKKGMDDGNFLNAHNSLRKVIFIGVEEPSLPPVSSPGGGDRDGSGDGDEGGSNTGLIAGVGIALGVGILVLCLVGRSVRNSRRRRGENESDESSHSSVFADVGTMRDLGDFETSNPHDLETVRVSNRESSPSSAKDREINVDLEDFESKEGHDGSFDFFDLILEGSQNKPQQQIRSRGLPSTHDDEVSEISF